ncbi:hypothetical protein T484DRAFT_1788870, partial [Baffinella frigidus]
MTLAHSVAGAVAAPESPVIHLSADARVLRVKAESPFPESGVLMAVSSSGKKTFVKYRSAADSPGAFIDGQPLLPAGLEFTAAEGANFPKDVHAVLPADAAKEDGIEALVVSASAGAFPLGGGAVVVRTRDGQTIEVNFKSVKTVSPVGSDSSRQVMEAAAGESFPAGVVSLALQGGGRDAVPLWLSKGFEATFMVAQTTAGPMQVYRSLKPVMGEVVLGGNAAAPAA